ncbi:MAG: hypothetical protein K0S27_1420 [Gammaproteobacteria bacterium]|jgi:Flp pilus assembly protein TadB|nr:hypothetical protein [Gammaproteobacteria bacterium]
MLSRIFGAESFPALRRAEKTWENWAPINWDRHNTRIAKTTEFAGGGMAVVGAITAPFALTAFATLVGSTAILLPVLVPVIVLGGTALAKLTHAFTLNRLKKMPIQLGEKHKNWWGGISSGERTHYNLVENHELVCGGILAGCAYVTDVIATTSVVHVPHSAITFAGGLSPACAFAALALALNAFHDAYCQYKEYQHQKSYMGASPGGGSLSDQYSEEWATRVRHLKQIMYSSLVKGVGWLMVAGGSVLFAASIASVFAPLLVGAGLITVAVFYYYGNKFCMFSSSKEQGDLKGKNNSEFHSYPNRSQYYATVLPV